MFNGFEVVIDSSDIGYYAEFSLHGNYYLGYLKIMLRFDGDFEGSTRLTTKHINEIKRSLGFKEYVHTLIMDEVRAKRQEINYALENNITKHVRGLRTWYSHGKVEVTINLGGGYERLEEDLDGLLEEFIQSETTKSHYPRINN